MIESYQNIMDECRKIFREELTAQVRIINKLRDALKFYADHGEAMRTSGLEDGGYIARKTLGETEQCISIKLS